MLAALVLLLALAAVFVRLGTWQLDRASERSQQAAARAAAQLAEADPVPIDEVVSPQSGITAEMVGRRVVVAGEYGAEQYLVAEAGPDGEPGVVLLAPLFVAEGAGAGAVLPVVRGWVAGPAEDWVGERAPGGALAAPTGPVRVVGSIAGSEAALAGTGADGTLESVSAGQLANLWGSPIYSGYVRLELSEPAEAEPLRPAPAPAVAAGGLPLQNLAYAAQWWVFGLFALLVWIRLLRDERARQGASLQG